MRATVWRHGQRAMGCLYHRVAWRECAGIKVQVDVFVRPLDVHSRGLAITAKRFRDPGSARRCDIAGPDDVAPLDGRLPDILRGLGCDAAAAEEMTETLVALLRREAVLVNEAISQARATTG